VTKHYYANGQRIASRVDGNLYYILGDHLGSTSLVVKEDGTQEGYVIYDAYGQVVENTLPEGLTDRLFTGQVRDDSIGEPVTRPNFHSSPHLACSLQTWYNLYQIVQPHIH
jgi:hypothetical protein